MAKPRITRDGVAALFGELTDQQMFDILDSGASQEDLEMAAAYIAQEDDATGARAPLVGAAAEVYEIVARDEEHPEEEHAP